MTTFPPVVRVVVDGEDVDAGNTNRPLTDLTARTDFLKEQLDLLSRSFEVLTKKDQPVGDSVLENQIVYFDATTGKFDLAVAELTAVGAPPQFEPTDRNFVQGIAQNIRGVPGSKICDLKQAGRITASDFSNLIETTEVITLGKAYWLTTASSEKGRSTKSRTGLEFLVGVFISTTEFFLFPQLKALGEEHIHYNFEIDNTKWIDLGPEAPLTGTLTFTAGSTTVTGVGTLFLTEVAHAGAIRLDADDFWVRVDTITSDTSLELVLPYASVGGTGVGSKRVGPFLIDKTEFDPFPPIPFESARMTLNGHLLIFDEDYTVTIDGLKYLSTALPPVEEMFEVQLFYLLPLSESSPGVTKLKSATPNVVIANCSPGGPIDHGDLKLSVIPKVVFSSTTAMGPRVLKTIVINSEGDLVFESGTVVEKLLAGPGISLSPESGNGTVIVTSTKDDIIFEDIPEILLQNAKQSLHGLTSYIEFPEDSRSAFFGKIRLPETLNTSEALKFIFEMIGESNTTAADTVSFELSYNIVEVSLTESLNKPKLTQTKTITLAADYIAFNTFTATVMEIPGTQLKPEAILSFSLRRLNTTDTYTGNIGIVSPRYRIVRT